MTTADVGESHHFDTRWVDWLVTGLLAGRRPARLVEIMVRRGFTPVYSERKVKEIRASPVLQAALRAHRKPAKLEELVSVWGTLFSRSDFKLEKRDLSPERFYQEFYFTNRPVVLIGLTDKWPAVHKWTPDYFRSRYGNVVVEITQRRDSDANYERNFSDHRTKVTFAQYVAMVEEGTPGNDRYLVARNHVLDLPGLSGLKADFDCPEGILDSASSESPYVRMWFGPGGTLTSLHCDDRNILFAQVIGRKHVKLIAPYFLACVYNEDSCYSPVALEAIDFDRYPAMRNVPVLETILEPGECLFIPVGWWHWVRSLDVSVSLAFTNFFHNEPPLIWTHATS